jgi:hypothetical protein
MIRQFTSCGDWQDVAFERFVPNLSGSNPRIGLLPGLAVTRPETPNFCLLNALMVLWHYRASSYNFPVTRERWAQLGITVQLLILVRTLGEIFRLRHVHGASVSAAVVMPYVGGALIAACACWVGVTLYFFRRYAVSAWIALGTVVILLAYKIGVIGR